MSPVSQMRMCQSMYRAGDDDRGMGKCLEWIELAEERKYTFSRISFEVKRQNLQLFAIMLSTTSVLLPSLLAFISAVYCTPIGPVVPVIDTTSGPVRGGVNSRSPAVFEYLGVPYAQPPVGSLRFGKPVAISEPLDLIDGTIPAKSCPQISVGLDDTYLNDVPEFTIGSNLTT